MELQGRLADLRRSGLGLAAISYDPVPVIADFAKRRGITFPLLSDAGSTVIKSYGLLNTTVQRSNQLQYGIPFPGTLVVNRQGIVTSRVFEETYQERDSISSVLVRLGGSIDAVGTRITAPQLTVITYLTDGVAAPGTRFSAVLDVTPQPGMHVYAPGVAGYRPIAIRVEPQAGLLLRDTHFPAGEIYHFVPLDERVPVFQKPFRIVQDFTLDPSPQAAAALKIGGTMTIDAALEYQACDDKVCYLPQTVPLRWTVGVRALDRERATPQR